MGHQCRNEGPVEKRISSPPIIFMSSSHHLRLIALIAALGGLLFGYDTAVISGAIGNLTDYFSLSPMQTGWAIASALTGCLAGALLADYFSTRFGRKRSMVIAALFFLACSVGTALPDSFTAFIVYRIIGGIGVGIASMVVPMYIAEIAPASKRGALVAYNQLAIVIGIVVVYFVNYFIALQGDDRWNLNQGWRWMFGSEAIPSVLYLVLLFFIPESPRWLLMKGKVTRAQAVLEKFNGQVEAKKVLEDITKSLGENTGLSRRLLLKPSFRLALGVGIGLSVFQQVTGINAILYYAPEIFKRFGSDANASLLETSMLGVVNLVFTIISISLVDKKGRKPLLLIGSAGMFIALAVVGIAAYFQVISTWLLPFLLLFMASFSISWGPVVWVLLSEIFPNQVRSLALSIAVFIQWAANFLVSQTFPLLTENQALQAKFHGAFPFIVFAVLCLAALWFVKKYVPETKNKTLEQMNELWKPE
jgi:MFS transporter, SP family, xylose:H+ symportor